MKRKKPAPPRIRHMGVQPIWTGTIWKFRARAQVNRRQVTGPLQETQTAASADYRRLLKEGSAAPLLSTAKTLQEGLDAACAAAKERGVKEITIKCHFGGHARYLLSFWSPETPLKLLSTKEIVWFIRTALEAGRSPNTIIEKDLPILGQVFQVAGLTSPIAEAKRLTRIRKVPRVQQGLPFEKGMAFVRDIRTAAVRDSRGTVLALPSRHWHADIAELVLWTGARANEIANLKIEDIDFEGMWIKLDAKVGVRFIAMDEELAQTLQRLIAEAVRRGTQHLVPGGMPGLGQILSRWSRRLGVKVNARGLRHSVAMHVVDSGSDMIRARNLLGHTNLTTTNDYINRSNKSGQDTLARIRKHGKRLLSEWDSGNS